MRLGRPKFLVYSTLLFSLGVAVAVREGAPITPGWWVAGQFLVWCIHLTTHYCNEFFDFDADKANTAPTRWTGGSRVLVEGHLPPIASLAAAFVLLFAGLAVVIAIPSTGARVTALAAIAMAWFYTAPPLRLNYRGLGETVVAAVLNLCAPLLAYQISTDHAPWLLLAIVFPTFMAQQLRMMVMNLADYDGDRSIGKRTLAITFGRRGTVRAFAAGQVVVYAVIAASAFLGMPRAVTVAMLLTAPVALWQALRLLRGELEQARTANSVVFWASTHVALIALAAVGGVLVDTAIHGVLGASGVACVAISLAYVGLLAPQIWANRVVRAR